jgi:hypothetical protein
MAATKIEDRVQTKTLRRRLLPDSVQQEKCRIQLVEEGEEPVT